MRALLALLTGLLGCVALAAGAAPARANPLIPEDLPDPTILHVAGGGYYLSGTSGSWAPLFPLWYSPDLRTWRRIGAVLPKGPSWARGSFWAPELTQQTDGSFRLYFSASEVDGKTCLAVTTATSMLGPWSDATKVLCRPGGVIDVSQPVTNDDGTQWIAFKAQGVGGGIYVQQLTPDGLGVTGNAQPLITPDQAWERGVTEGPSLLHHDGQWYLFYAGATCCRPPCTYGEGVASAPTLLGPYTKLGRGPILVGDRQFKCPGHGTLLDLGQYGVIFVHHAYRTQDVSDRRRVVMLSLLRWDGPNGAPTLRLDSSSAVAVPHGFSDGFGGTTLATGWEWPFDHDPGGTVVKSELRLTCAFGGRRVIGRQVALDDFAAVVHVDGRGGVAAISPGPVVRGVEIADGRARAFRESSGGRLAGPWQDVPDTTVRLFVHSGGAVGAQVGGVPIDMTVAARGEGPTRLGLTCAAGDRPAAFASARVKPISVRR